MGPYLVCLVTVDDAEKAAEIATFLVQKKIVACVNILPAMRSIYQWKGEVCDESEHLMLMKTREALFQNLVDAVRELHPYEVPEIVSLKIEHGLPEYLRWIDESTFT